MHDDIVIRRAEAGDVVAIRNIGVAAYAPYVALMPITPKRSRRAIPGSRCRQTGLGMAVTAISKPNAEWTMAATGCFSKNDSADHGPQVLI